MLLVAGIVPVWSVEARDLASAASAAPLWEAGVFAGAIHLPHYRGSDEYSVFALPLPYVIYRGDMLRVDREGLGVFWGSARFESGLSLHGNPPPRKDGTARQGMPDLGAIVEFGPKLEYFILDRDSPQQLSVEAAIRAAISVDRSNLHTAYQGLRSGLKAVYRKRIWVRDKDSLFAISAGIDMTDRGYNSYFYDVAPAYATASRPVYRAGHGYAGSYVSMTGQKRISERCSIGVYYRWDHLPGAAYRSSPLVNTNNNHTFGLMLIWDFFRSKKEALGPAD